MTPIVISPQASLDLAEIGIYLARRDSRAAERFLGRIAQVFQTLAASPFLGRERPELAESLRSFPVGDYLVFYRPIEDTIHIVRVFSGHRDIGPSFFF